MPDKSIKPEDIQVRRGAGLQIGNEAPSPNGIVATMPQRIKPPKDTNWVNRGAQWRPEHYEVLRALAFYRKQEFRKVLETIVAEYIERHKGEIPSG